MRVEVTKTRIKVFREEGDKLIRSESAFFYAVLWKLKKMGHDVIKKCPEKDGHMHGAPYYIRQRKWKWAAVDWDYQVRLIHKEYNKHGETYLTIETWDEQEELKLEEKKK